MGKKIVSLIKTHISYLFFALVIIGGVSSAFAAGTLWQVTPSPNYIYFGVADCDVVSQTLCPSEMGWEGNTIYYAFNLPADQMQTQKLVLEFNVPYGNYGTPTPPNVVLEISAGKTKTSLIVVNPSLEIKYFGKFRIRMDSNLFQKGAVNYIKVYGVNVTPIGTGTNPPNFQTDYIKLSSVEPAPALADEELLDKTEAQSANFFYDYALNNGLVKDTISTDNASIAATGFGLTAFPIMAQRYGTSPDWKYSPDHLRARVNKILDTLIAIQDSQEAAGNSYGKSGLFFHYITDSNTCASGSEVSTVDSAILFAGAITAGEYFGREVKQKADTLVSKVDWNYFLRSPSNTFPTINGINYQFTHGWKPTSERMPETWDRPSDETLLISIIALASSPSNSNNVDFQKSFFSWPRVKRSYGGYEVINSFFGSLFTYEFAHVWVDFAAIGADNPAGIMAGVTGADWWQNSINAAKAARQFAIDNSAHYSSYDEDSWGLSAVQKPDRNYYGKYGAAPVDDDAIDCRDETGWIGTMTIAPCHDGTIAPYSSISAMPFFKSEDGGVLMNNKSFRVLRNLYDEYYWDLWDNYGPKDSFNNRNEFSSAYIGIDVGATATMIENYRSDFVWKQFLKNTSIKYALKKVFACPNGVCSIKGDANDDGLVALNDAILVLQFMTNSNTSQSVALNADVNADVNNDSKLGLSEVIYVLQTVADMR